MTLLVEQVPVCRCASSREPTNSPAAPLIALLEELAAVVDRLDERQYVQKPVGVMPGSVGAHIRHSLDHVAAIHAARESGRLDYDHRERGTPVETDPPAALAVIRSHIDGLSEWTLSDLDKDIRLSVLLAVDGDPVHVGTTLGRELAYTISHTIHHNAILGAMIKTLGGALPERFGYAPSTILQVMQWKAG